MNKRGQGLSVNAIIMIVLGVVVLAVLILGFTMGWNNIVPWIGGGNNVKTIVTACDVACGTQSVYDYCTFERELKDAEGKEVEATCEILAKSNPEYGIKACEGLCVTTKVCAGSEGLNGKLVDLSAMVLDCGENEKEVMSSDSTRTKICCVAKA